MLYKGNRTVKVLNYCRQLLIHQNNSCPICLSLISLSGLQGKKAQIDHDHKSGIIRGILCRSCNSHLVGCYEAKSHPLKYITGQELLKVKNYVLNYPAKTFLI